MEKNPTKSNQSTSNDIATQALKGIGIIAGAYIAGQVSKSAADAYNTKRKYDSIDNGVNNLLGSIPIIGGLFK